MLRQLNLLPLLVIPVAAVIFGIRNDANLARWLTGPEKPIGPATTERIRLDSSNTRKSYDIDVQLPAGYASGAQAYPVIYSAHDGPYLIQYESVIAPLLRRSKFPEVIVVNVRPAGPAEPVKGPRNPLAGAARSSAWADDLTLQVRVGPDGRSVGGKAAAFADFFEKELIPHIEGAYRCVPGERCLAGFDIGALFALETALTRPHVFNRILVLAPVAQWADRAVIKLAQGTVASGFDPALRIYLTIGSVDDQAHLRSFKELSAVFASRTFKHLRVRSQIVPNRKHSDVVVPAAIDGLRFLYPKRR